MISSLDSDDLETRRNKARRIEVIYRDRFAVAVPRYSRGREAVFTSAGINYIF